MSAKKRNWITVLLALSGVFMFSWRLWPPLAEVSTIRMKPDTMPSLAGETYGFDRLEATEGEQWLPAVEVAAEGEVKSVVHQLDTLAWETWKEYASRILYYDANSATLPLTPGSEVLLWRHAHSVFPGFFHHLQAWTNFREISWDTLWPTGGSACSKDRTTLVLLEEGTPLSLTALSRLPLALADQNALVLYFGQELPRELQQLQLPTLFLPPADEISEAMAAQALFGAMDLLLPEGELQVASRLGHAPPEAVGIDRRALARMDRYISRAIRRRAMPGCQVLVAKNGKIILEKSYGFHTYEEARAVNNQDVYDLASITKAAATTLGIMRLQEKGQLQLGQRLREVLPAYAKTNLRYLRLRHLLAHHTGLQANLPIAKWLGADDSFRQHGGPDYPRALDQDCYLKAGVREAILAQLHDLRIPRRLYYRYSDVNFLLLQEVLENKAGTTLDTYLATHFYEPLGLQRLQFRPGLSIPASEIVPTQYDKQWRKTVVQGEVHDESAALLGGVAGHAGLFSNARDLAVIFQMLLNGGSYGQRTYLQPETVATFTARNGYNHRAFGFDRLAAHSKSLRYYGASLETFGHTGFTGTCVWADPAHNLIFIFLSNRTFPDKHNNKLQQLGLRERLHKIVYQSLNTAKEEV